jgi:hypothetical protein
VGKLENALEALARLKQVSRKVNPESRAAGGDDLAK